MKEQEGKIVKKIAKKNQIVIATLAVMIAAAGYMNYSGKLFPGKTKTQETNSELANKELLDISDEDTSVSSGDIKSQDGDTGSTDGNASSTDDGSVDGTPGEAVLANGTVSSVAAQAKVSREQVRSKNKETLQSRKGEPDRTPEQMRQDIDVFLRECRKEYRKAGLEFKYIHVMEIGKKGARHHHLVVNKIDTEILQRCWYKAYEGHNRVKVFPLDDSGNYAELASYLIKYTGTHKKGTDGALQGKRWNCSKNLVRPEPEYHIISDREYFKKEPKAIKGYYVDKNSVSMGVHSPEYYGYGYLRYTLVKITDRGGVEMQIIKGVAIAAVLIIAGLLALIVAAYLAFRIAAAIFEQQESWKDSGSRKGRKHDRKN
jgi:hypothetical protein